VFVIQKTFVQTENEYKKSWISSQIDNETHQKPKQLPYHNAHIQPYLSFDMSRTTVALCLALIQLASSKALSPRWNNSVQNVLDQALVALGGENVISALGGVTYSSPTSVSPPTIRVYHAANAL
jgi:hypothetical protein